MNVKKKKGIIFSLDGAIAATVVIIMLINTTYYFTTTSKESLSQSQLVKRGYDVIETFDKLGYLEDVMNELAVGENVIPENMLNVSLFLPFGYDMLVEIYDGYVCVCGAATCPGGCTLNAGTNVNCDLPGIEDGYKHVQIFVEPMSFSSGDIVNVNYGSINIGFTEVKNKDMHLTSLEPHNFRGGGLTFNLEGAGEYEIKYFKILDDDFYVASTSSIIHEVPNDRFVGVGERWFSSFDGAMFEGMHLARFYVWLKK